MTSKEFTGYINDLEMLNKNDDGRWHRLAEICHTPYEPGNTLYRQVTIMEIEDIIYIIRNAYTDKYPDKDFVEEAKQNGVHTLLKHILGQ